MAHHRIAGRPGWHCNSRSVVALLLRRFLLLELSLVAILSLLGARHAPAYAAETDPCAPQKAAPQTTSTASPPRSFHYLFLIDTSKSMIGFGDGQGRVLLPRVKEEVEKFLGRIPPGSKVTIQPFDDGPKPAQTFEIPQQLATAVDALRRIEAKGTRTCIYRTLSHVLAHWPGDQATGVIVHLFTDGNNNCPPPPTLDDIKQAYTLQRGPYDWVYYILLGVELSPELEQALKGETGWELLAVAPNHVPRLPVVAAEPTALDLGNLYGEDEVRRDIVLRTESEPEGALRLRTRAVAPQLAAFGAGLSVEPQAVTASGRHSLTFQLLNGETVPPNQSYQAYLCIEALDSDVVMKPISVPVRFGYHPKGVFRFVPLDSKERLILASGESAALRYRVEGNEWARESVTITPGPVGEGLELLLNGRHDGLHVAPGEEFTVELRNAGIQARSALQPQLTLNYPSGTTGPNFLALPPVTRAPTRWEEFLGWWWLWLPSLLLLGVLLFRQRPWGYLHTVGPPEECAQKSGSCRGRREIDVGQATGESALNGVMIARRGQRPVLAALRGDSVGYKFRTSGFPVEEGEPLDWGEPVQVELPDGREASFTVFRKRPRRETGGRK